MQALPNEQFDSLIDIEALQKNARQIDLVRVVLFMVGGIMCGLLGLTGLHGFLFYLGINVTISLSIAAKMGFDCKAYTNDGLLPFILSGLSAQFMSFIMFWTLTYSLVYVY